MQCHDMQISFADFLSSSRAFVCRGRPQLDLANEARAMADADRSGLEPQPLSVPMKLMNVDG